MKTEAARSPDGVRIYAPEDFEGMRRAGRLVAETLDMIEDHVRPGVTTGELDKLCQAYVEANGGTSATIGYRGYQHASCISINHVVCHGIPGDRALKDGDILNIDVTVIVEGWYGDSSRMYVAGTPSVKAKRLIEITYHALMQGIEAVKSGARFGDVGAAIQTYAEARRCSVVREFCGHGLGRVFHDSPNVLHFGRPGTREAILPGMFFTIEPMLNLGRPETKILADGWTAVTRDMSLSAQYEHSVGVTETGVEIFTLSPAGRFTPPWLR